MVIQLPNWAASVVSSISISGVAEETLATILGSAVLALMMWKQGRESMQAFGARSVARATSLLRWCWHLHPFYKITSAWWTFMMVASVLDTYVTPIPAFAYNFGFLWMGALFAMPPVLWLCRRISARG